MLWHATRGLPRAPKKILPLILPTPSWRIHACIVRTTEESGGREWWTGQEERKGESGGWGRGGEEGPARKCTGPACGDGMEWHGKKNE